ncbi:Na+/K+ ATPase alpha subunit [Candida maltosa Xu316]|uniref:Na+/K+ ATPase alpha subunit n=1 Tax=Candida maltosa (strain Xu316) TaxID=1245528 RepID=M3HQZ7_CANMX|nr:Na+/K+ ATPase alpha subunit [Candida maltosa Xu316]
MLANSKYIVLLYLTTVISGSVVSKAFGILKSVKDIAVEQGVPIDQPNDADDNQMLGDPQPPIILDEVQEDEIPEVYGMLGIPLPPVYADDE